MENHLPSQNYLDKKTGATRVMFDTFAVLDTSTPGLPIEVKRFSTHREALDYVYSWGNKPEIGEDRCSSKQATITRYVAGIQQSARTPHYYDVFKRTWLYNPDNGEWKIHD